MQISKKINFFDNGTVTVKYYEEELLSKDATVYRYDDYKISLRLTDGLFGVLGTKVMGGKKGDIYLYAPDEIHFGRFTTNDLHRYMHIFIPMVLSGACLTMIIGVMQIQVSEQQRLLVVIMQQICPSQMKKILILN